LHRQQAEGGNKVLHLAYCVKEERLRISGNKVRDLNGMMMQQENKENYKMKRASLYLWLNIAALIKSV
jgi:hypothetical protein